MLSDLGGIRRLLLESRIIAIVGISPKEARPSNMVARYLRDAGFTIIPVNPGHEQILGLRCYPDLLALPCPVDIVDVFRRPDEIGAVVDQAIQTGARALWLQEGVINPEAAEKARKAGLFVVMDRCIKTDHSCLL